MTIKQRCGLAICTLAAGLLAACSSELPGLPNTPVNPASVDGLFFVQVKDGQSWAKISTKQSEIEQVLSFVNDINVTGETDYDADSGDGYYIRWDDANSDKQCLVFISLDGTVAVTNDAVHSIEPVDIEGFFEDCDIVQVDYTEKFETEDTTNDA